MSLISFSPPYSSQPVRELARVRIQWWPNLVRAEKRICLTRIRWESGGPVGVRGGGCSNKLSVSVIWEPRDAWVGLYWNKTRSETSVYVCILPFLPIRFKHIQSWGGVFP